MPFTPSDITSGAHNVSDMPKHIGIIMDGNGRWAEERGLSRHEGHRKGVETLRQTVRNVADMGISYLTVFSFSVQNWGRPKPEVDFLMSLFERYIERDLAELHSQGVRLRMLGRRNELSPKICQMIERAETLTAHNDKLHLQIAFNYGGREELADAAARLAMRAAAGLLDAGSITTDVLDAEMLSAGMPDPDLIIRTSGEYRLSNFLFWQSAYSEFYFTDTLWPDFDIDNMQDAIDFYTKRERRFGLTMAQLGEAE